LQDFFSIVGSFGFPVAVASYLLFRFEKKLEDLAQINASLVTEVKSLKELNSSLLSDIKCVQKKIDQLEKIIKDSKSK
jgi:hypothetical protein